MLRSVRGLWLHETTIESMRFLLFITFSMVAGFAQSAEPSRLLAPPDTSSPRTTLQTFNDSINDVYRIAREEGRSLRSAYQRGANVERMLRCLDLSEIPPVQKRSFGTEAAVCLKEVLDRHESLLEKDIPDAAAMQKLSEAGEPLRWRFPHTEITIARIKDGPREGEYLFTPYTVNRASDFYERVKHLPYKADASKGLYNWYRSQPGWMIPGSLIRSLPAWTRSIIGGQTVWQWIGLVLALLLGIVAMLVLYRIAFRLDRHLRQEQSILLYCLSILFPISAAFVPLALDYFISHQLYIVGSVHSVLTFSLDLVFLGAVIFVISGSASRLAELIIASPRINPVGVDAQFIRLVLRVLSIVAAVIVVLEGGQHIGIPLTTLLAGAGVGGLALALAAQDTLKNVFGSLMIMLDKPFRVGERVIVKGYDGVVEEIGLRSTKLRLLTGNAASIPNEEMARSDIENVGRRPHIRRTATIGMPSDTPTAKVKRALEIVRTAIDNHEGMQEEFPPRVFLRDLNESSIGIFMIYWYHPPKYWDYLAFTEKVNLQIMEQLEAEDIPFAAPALTVHTPDHQSPELDAGMSTKNDESEGD